jgi:nicotinamide riboside transporter PnuC
MYIAITAIGDGVSFIICSNVHINCSLALIGAKLYMKVKYKVNYLSEVLITSFKNSDDHLSIHPRLNR